MKLPKPQKLLKKFLILALGLSVIVTLMVVYKNLPVSPFVRAPGSQNSQADAKSVRVEMVAQNLKVPWSLAFADNERLFFTERGNSLRLIENGQLRAQSIAQVDSTAAGEGGLLGLALDPNFKDNGFLYLYYTYTSNGELFNKVVRHQFKDYALVEPKTILDKIPAGQIHDGGRLKFGPDGKLYITTGDAGQPDLAQDLTSLAGKILRVNQDGSIPSDNPFPNSPIYSYGHRNPQGLAWHPQTKQLYATEHGAKAHDEVNLIGPGVNYGWPKYSGRVLSNESRPGLPNYRDPIAESGSDTWAPSGATFYAGDKFPKDWHNRLLFAGLRSKALWRLNLNGNNDNNLESLFNEEYGRLRDVVTGPDGNLYLATSNQDGRGSPTDQDDRILRIVPDY